MSEMGERRLIYLSQELGGQKIVELSDNFVAVIKYNNGKCEIEAIFELGQNEKGQKSSERIKIEEAKSRSETLRDKINQLEQKLIDGYQVELNSEKTEEKELQKIKAKMIEALEKNEIITYGLKGEIICDLEKIKNLQGEIFKGARDFDVHGNRIKVSWQRMIMEIFAGKKVISQKDYEKRLSGDESVKEKPLFYLPKNKDEAFDINKIRQADFYLTISDFNSAESDKIDPAFQKLAGIGALEAEVAVRIYHPAFGAGFRNPEGKLMVKKDINNEGGFVKLNTDWLSGSRRKKYNSGTKKSNVFHSPRIGLATKRFKNLRESGLLTPDDFGQQENSPTSEIFRIAKKIGIKGGTNVGTFYQDESGEKKYAFARYTLGTEFEDKELVKLAENLFGIVDEVQGIKRVTHIFEPADITLIKQKQKEYEDKYGKKPKPASVHFGKRDKNSPKPVEFKLAKISQQREDESAEDYAERVAAFNAVKEYNKLQQVSKDLSEIARIGIHNLSLREQNALTSYAFENNENYQKVLDFAKKYGQAGLKTFLACEYDMSAGNKILKIGEKLSQPVAKKILAKYQEITKMSSLLVEQLQGIFSQDLSWNEDTLKNIKESLLKKGKDLLDYFAGLSEKESKNKELEIIQQLENTKNEIILLASVFKSVAKEKQIKPEELAGLSLEIKTADQLNNETRKQMMQIFKANRPNYPAKLLKASANKFEEALSSPKATFHVISHGKDIVAFIRFEELPNGHHYAGSLNVRNEAKDLAIGGALLSQTLDAEATKYVIEADAYALIPMLKNYVEKFGFLIVGFDQNYHGSGEPFYKLIRNDEQRNELAGPKLKKEKIAELENRQPESDDNFTILRLKPNVSAQEHELLLKPYFEKGYLISRYLQQPDGQVLVYLEQEPAKAEKVNLAA